MTSQTKNHDTLCNAEQSCLMLVDVQERLASTMPDKVLLRIERNLLSLLRAAKSLSIPIIISEQYPRGLGETLPNLLQEIPEDAFRFEKTCFSCTGVESFNEYLKSINRTQVIISGMEAHICVLQTALSLCQQDKNVFVVADTICSRLRDNYESSLKRMRSEGIHITETESVLFEWVRDASHPLFRDIVQMVS